MSSIVINSSGDIFVSAYNIGTERGSFFRSLDNGDTWHEIESVIEDAAIYALALDTEDILYAGSARNGIFRSIQPTAMPPRIFSVADVPNDLGGRVTITWKASFLDTTETALQFYGIWRALPEGEMIEEGRTYRVIRFNNQDYIWEWLANHPAQELSRYSTTAETFFDSSATNNGNHFFLISAHTSNPDVYYSLPENGYSVNNLLPQPVEGKEPLPAYYRLHQNYPNPFNPATTIDYALAQAGHVQLTIFNLLGQRVRTLVDA